MTGLIYSVQYIYRVFKPWSSWLIIWQMPWSCQEYAQDESVFIEHIGWMPDFIQILHTFQLNHAEFHGNIKLPSIKVHIKKNGSQWKYHTSIWVLTTIWNTCLFPIRVRIQIEVQYLHRDTIFQAHTLNGGQSTPIRVPGYFCVV